MFAQSRISKSMLMPAIAGAFLVACDLVPPDERRNDTAPDASPGQPDSMPDGTTPATGWDCDPEYYADGACDCECGAVDPDCLDDPREPWGCEGQGQICAPDATCQGPDVPAEWSCDWSFFDANDGCDCACGAVDPDCLQDSSAPYNCDEGQVCGADGACRTLDTALSAPPVPVPPEWHCDETWYGDDQGCDCECGAVDPDCLKQESEVLWCEDEDQICGPDATCRWPT